MALLINVAIWPHGRAVISVLRCLEQLLCVCVDIFMTRQHSLCKHLGGLMQFLAAIASLLHSGTAGDGGDDDRLGFCTDLCWDRLNLGVIPQQDRRRCCHHPHI